MKKFWIILLVLVNFIFLDKVSASSLPPVTDHEKIVINVFYGNECPHCHDLLTFLNDKYDKYKDYIEIHAYETWVNEENKNFFNEVKEQLQITETGVPMTIIGTKGFSGYTAKLENEMIDEFLYQYQNSGYVNAVGEIADSTQYDIKEESLKEAMITSKLIEDDSKKGMSDGAIIGIIFLVVVAGLGGLVFVARK